MRTFISILFILSGFFGSAQSFSDYSRYVQENGFLIRAKSSDTIGLVSVSNRILYPISIVKDSTYVCHIVQSESSYYYHVVIDNESFYWMVGDPLFSKYFKRED
jgi:hypothetical protein